MPVNSSRSAQRLQSVLKIRMAFQVLVAPRQDAARSRESEDIGDKPPGGGHTLEGEWDTGEISFG